MTDTAAVEDIEAPADPSEVAALRDQPKEIKLADLKDKSPSELVAFAEEYEVENASTLRKQELMFAILKQLAFREEVEIIPGRVSSRSCPTVLVFCGRPDVELPRPAPTIFTCRRAQIRRFSASARAIRSRGRSGRRKRASAILLSSRSTSINFEDPEKVRPQDPF